MARHRNTKVKPAVKRQRSASPTHEPTRNRSDRATTSPNLPKSETLDKETSATLDAVSDQALKRHLDSEEADGGAPPKKQRRKSQKTLTDPETAKVAKKESKDKGKKKQVPKTTGIDTMPANGSLERNELLEKLEHERRAAETKADSQQREIEQLKGENDILTAQLHQKENELQATESTTKKTTQQVQEAREATEAARYAASQEFNGRLQALEDLYKLKTRHEKVSAKAEKLQNLKDNLEQTVSILRKEICDLGNQLQDKELPYDKVSDDKILGDWNRLTFFIEQTVTLCLKNPAILESDMMENPNVHANGTLQLSKSTNDLSSGFRMSCFQGYLWRRISKDIFAGDRLNWAGPVARTFSAFSKDLQRTGLTRAQDAELMSSIKSWTAQQLDQCFGTDEKATSAYTDALVEDLSVFIATEEEPQIPLRDCLSQVVHLAKELRVCMAKSKAFFWTEWPMFSGEKFASVPNHEDMHVCWWEPTHALKKQEVLHVVTPRLWKCGLADGGGFEHKTILVDSVLVVTEATAADATVNQSDDALSGEGEGDTDVETGPQCPQEVAGTEDDESDTPDGEEDSNYQE